MHFHAVAARIMRGILVGSARARRSQNADDCSTARGHHSSINLDQIPDIGYGRAEEILAVHEALEHLAQMEVSKVWLRREIRRGMLTGRRPFADDVHLRTDYHLPPHVPNHAALGAIIHRCLAMAPPERFSSAVELRDALIPALRVRESDGTPWLGRR